jgi:hypothetical protein
MATQSRGHATRARRPIAGVRRREADMATQSRGHATPGHPSPSVSFLQEKPQQSVSFRRVAVTTLADGELASSERLADARGKTYCGTFGDMTRGIHEPGR